jgi:hypothetical protein
MLHVMKSCVGVALSIVAFSSNAAAQQRKDDPCSAAAGDETIAACTRDIASGKFKSAALSQKLQFRAVLMVRRAGRTGAAHDVGASSGLRCGEEVHQ